MSETRHEHKIILSIIIYSCFVHLIIFSTNAYLANSLKNDFAKYPGGEYIIYDAVSSVTELIIFYLVCVSYCIGLFLFCLFVFWRTREPFITLIVQLAFMKTIMHLVCVKALYNIIVFWATFSSDDEEMFKGIINVEKIRAQLDLFFIVEILPFIVSVIFVIKGMWTFSHDLLYVNAQRLLPAILRRPDSYVPLPDRQV